MEARLNREMVKVSQKTIVLADSTKFGKRVLVVCVFEDIDEIITAIKISDFTREAIERKRYHSYYSVIRSSVEQS